MRGENMNGSHSPEKGYSTDSADEQKLLPTWSQTPIIVHVPKSPGSSLRSRSRYRAGPVRKIRKRAVLKNGECNVLQSKISRRSVRFLQDIFTTLVDTQWRWTLMCFALSFLLSWLGFAVLWWLIAFTHGDFMPDHLNPPENATAWKPCVAALNSFTSCFLFSIETQHTIGYGGRSTTEECPEAIFVMCLQSIAGVMIQAFMVGIVFAKMTRPKQRTQTLLFSRNAVICQRDGELCLMFRVGDMRKSHIIGATVRAKVIRSRTTKEGEFLSQNQQELEVSADGNDGDLFFIWPTIIVHKINADSPFFNMSAEDMLTERFEVVVILEGTVESTGQTTQARSSYLPQEVLWGHRFEPMVSYSKERQGYEVDYSLFNNTTQVDTPLCSGRELAEFYRVQDDLRHGAGYLIDEEGLLIDTYHDGQTHHLGHHHQSALNVQGHHLVHTDSTKSAASENSFEDSALGRSIYRDNSILSHLMHHPPTHQHKVIDMDPDGIEVIGDSELRQLPEAVNREILKNSREIIYAEDPRDVELHREDSFLTMRPFGSRRYYENPELKSLPPIKRNVYRYMTSDDEKRTLTGSKRNLSHKNLVQEDDRRSLNGSRRNLHGSKRSVKAENLYDNNRQLSVEHKESLIGSRRHTGSKEHLAAVKNNIEGIKGSKETPELRTRRRFNETSLDNRNGEVEVGAGELANQSSPPPLQQVALERYLAPTEPIVARSEVPVTPSDIVVSPPDSVLTPSEFVVSQPESVLSRSEYITSPSELSPESGIVEGSRSSTPEAVLRNLKLPEKSVIARNRRSYEHAQLQDVNEKLTRPESGSSSSDSESPQKSNPPTIDMSGKIAPKKSLPSRVALVKSSPSKTALSKITQSKITPSSIEQSKITQNKIPPSKIEQGTMELSKIVPSKNEANKIGPGKTETSKTGTQSVKQTISYTSV